MSEASVRHKLKCALDQLRDLITRGELMLFIGEQASCLKTDNQSTDIGLEHIVNLITSYDDVENLVETVDRCEDTEDGTKEAQMKGKRLDSKHRLHDILRTLGRFPIIFTVNIDKYVEQHLIQTNERVETVRLDQVTSLAGHWPNSTRVLLIKCIGDASYNAHTQATKQSIDFWKNLPNTTGSKEAQFVQYLFNKKSVLFLGCNKADYERFLNTFINTSKMRHYMYVMSHEETGSTYEESGQLSIIQSDMVLAEFAQYLTPGSSEMKLIPGKVAEASFLPTQREQYLMVQLDLEKQARDIGYLTMQVTNALSTDELLENTSRTSIKGMFEKDPFYGEYTDKTVAGVMTAMYGRRDNLLEMVRKGTSAKVTSVFSLTTFMNEISESTELEKRKMAIRKYATVMLESRSITNSKSSLEVQVLSNMKPEFEKRMEGEQFCIMRLKSGSDEAIAYAHPAVTGKKSFTTNLVSINGEEVAHKRKVYEEYKEMADSHEATLLKITSAVLQADAKTKALDDKTKRKLNQLHNIHLITDTEIEPGTLEELGEGSFGTVYKGKWKNKNIAFKVLKNLESDALDAFTKEFDTLRRIDHPNIVKVMELCLNKNVKQLGIIMELMGGGSVHGILAKSPGKGQEKVFVQACALQVARALNYLHGKKIVHRDIKADNIFMSVDHKIFKVGDFGLAREAATYQTKTMNRGAYRYMAPEVQKTGKYSFKVDVYSYGLLLLEITSGRTVFAEIIKHEEVYKQIGQGQIEPQTHITENVERDYGSAIKFIAMKCIEYESKRRPKMADVLDILEGRNKNLQTFGKNEIELVCIGTGKGATAITRGGPSSSFAIFKNGKPILLVDLGLGVMMSYKEHIGHEKLPVTVFITHNHTDHAGELPVSMIVMYQQFKDKNKLKLDRSPITVISGPDVIPILTKHRMHEAFSMEPDVNKFATWIDLNPKDKAIPIDAEKEIGIQTVKSQHGEVCYGFILYYNGHPILGYSGDSGFEQELYDAIFQADTVIVDARQKGTVEHAGFDEVEQFIRDKQLHNKVYVTGYGMPDEYPAKGCEGLLQLETGETYTIWPFDKSINVDVPEVNPEGEEYPQTENAIK